MQPTPDPSFDALRASILAGFHALRRGLPTPPYYFGGGWHELAFWRAFGHAWNAGELDFLLRRPTDLWETLHRLVESGQFDPQIREWSWVGIPG